MILLYTQSQKKRLPLETLPEALIGTLYYQ